MQEQIKKTVRVAEINAKTEYEKNKLVYENNLFVTAKYEDKEENIEFTFDVSRLKNCENIRKESEIDKFRLLLNVKELYRECEEYIVIIDTKNMYYDYNMNPKLMFRDIVKIQDISFEEDFLLQYKSMVAYVYQKKYSFDDYYLGGKDLMKRDPFLKKVRDCDNITVLWDLLYNEYLNRCEKLTKTKKLVDKNKYKMDQIIKKISMSLLIVCFIYSGILFFYKIPIKNNIIAAHNYYIQKDFEKVISHLESVSIDKIPYETKYIDVISYVNGENINSKQKQNILATITLNSNENIFDFWIQLGRKNYNEAINLAKKINDDQYLMYAYIKQLYYVENSEELSGNKKQDKINLINSEISEINQRISDAKQK